MLTASTFGWGRDSLRGAVDDLDQRWAVEPRTGICVATRGTNFQIQSICTAGMGRSMVSGWQYGWSYLTQRPLSQDGKMRNYLEETISLRTWHRPIQPRGLVGFGEYVLQQKPHDSISLWILMLGNGYIPSINGHFRNLNWRYLPYIRPIVQA